MFRFILKAVHSCTTIIRISQLYGRKESLHMYLLSPVNIGQVVSGTYQKISNSHAQAVFEEVCGAHRASRPRSRIARRAVDSSLS
jgi:hypothetical protein